MYQCSATRIDQHDATQTVVKILLHEMTQGLLNCGQWFAPGGYFQHMRFTGEARFGAFDIINIRGLAVPFFQFTRVGKAGDGAKQEPTVGSIKPFEARFCFTSVPAVSSERQNASSAGKSSG
jgi:hypothetical protein